MGSPTPSCSPALVVIDMQNDFCLPDAILCVKGAMGCLPKVVEAVDSARAASVPVLWVVREHDASGVDVERTRKHLFEDGKPGATVTGTPGADLVEPLKMAAGEHKVVKLRFSAFFQTRLDMLLRRMGCDTVLLCGVQTPNCIRGAAWDSLSLDYRTVVLHDATASKSPEVQAANLQDMKDAGIEIVSVADWFKKA